MLSILDDLFERLNEQNVSWTLFKSYCDLEDDLNGNRGDIDILVSKKDENSFIEICLILGFVRVKNKFNRHYFIGFCNKAKKTILLDVAFGKIQYGKKPLKLNSIELDPNNMLTFRSKSCVMLERSEYLYLNLLLRSHKQRISEVELLEMRELINNFSQKESSGYVRSQVSRFLKKQFYQVKSVPNLSWSQIRSVVKSNTFLDSVKNCISSLALLQNKLNLFRWPAGYQLSRGGIVIAFVGIDGSGKSTAVKYLENHALFKDLCIKKFYLGNNNYILPGLSKLQSMKSKINVFNKFISLLIILDKWIRFFFVFVYRYLGYMVIVDRYFYDDEIGRQLNFSSGEVKKFYQRTIAPRPIWMPDLTVYLDVDTHTAFKRKQDYPYEFMERVNCLYKNYFNSINQARCALIDANEPEKKVKNEILRSVIATISKR